MPGPVSHGQTPICGCESGQFRRWPSNARISFSRGPCAQPNRLWLICVYQSPTFINHLIIQFWNGGTLVATSWS